MAQGHNKKARKLGRSGRIDYVDLYNIFKASGGDCEYCGIGITPEHCTFDHVVAFDRGGDNVVANIKACCLQCQRRKFTKSSDEFEEWRNLQVTCPVDGVVFRPRWADHVRGYGKYCSRACAGAIGGQISKR